MSYFKKPELNERDLSVMNQVITKLAEDVFNVKLGLRSFYKERKKTLRDVEEDSEKLHVAYSKFANRVFRTEV